MKETDRMAEKKKFTAHANRKGLDATGVTEDHARRMAATLGGHTMLVVEARHDAMTTDAEGNVSVALALTSVEPVPEDLEDVVRDFQRALYRRRPEVQGQEVLAGTDGTGLNADQAAQVLDSRIERDDDGRVTGVWDGDTDTPLTAVPDATDGCAYPGCTLDDDHDGDHDVPGAQDDADAAK